MKEPKYVAETLKWCNERRKGLGKRPLKKLPKGIRGDGSSCPCGKATGLWVGDVRYAESLDKMCERGKPVTLYVSDFVHAFDSGKLPQYEL